jgi:hypothetical protein
LEKKFMADDYTNPFDRPLDSELQEHQQQQAATVQSSPNGNPFDEPLLSEKLEAQAKQAGQVSNDVGNTVIIPKDGESFADTMQRAAAYGKTVTPQQVNAELKSAPAKTATVLAAAPAIGAAGTAALAAPGELVDLAIKHLAGNVLPGMEEQAARAKLAQIAPKALQIVKEWALPTSAIGGLLKLLSMGKGK